jgi:DNA uptake protein ComE-like DNA-binding protein
MEIRQDSGTRSMIDLNTASFTEIASISVVGEERAQILISRRPFRSWEDITMVPGFSKGMVENLKDSAVIL